MEKGEKSKETHKESRFQFGGFVTPQSSLLAKWREEYGEFVDEVDETPAQRSIKSVDSKDDGAFPS